MAGLNRTRRLVSGGLLALAMMGLSGPGPALAETTFTPIPTQFIAALADPAATSGTGAEHWGLWREDPGPRGVRLTSLDALLAAGGVAPAKWTFDNSDWWLEEHGLIMEQPAFGMPPGRYLVTGNQSKQSVLTIHPQDAAGAQAWDLSGGVSLGEVTHLRCRSARYTPEAAGKACSPTAVPQDGFPVAPGAAMPPVPGCAKQDYAVLFIIGIAE